MPKTLERSVSGSAGIESAFAAATAPSSRAMPSTIEYSLCRRRWMNFGCMGGILRPQFQPSISIRLQDDCSPVHPTKAKAALITEGAEDAEEGQAQEDRLR